MWTEKSYKKITCKNKRTSKKCKNVNLKKIMELSQKSPVNINESYENIQSESKGIV